MTDPRHRLPPDIIEHHGEPITGSMVPDSVLVDEEKLRQAETKRQREVRERNRRERKRQQERELAKPLMDPLATKPGREILSSFARYHYLTGRQVTRLLYSPGSRKFALHNLKLLTDAGYLQMANYLIKNPPTQSPERVWSLTSLGRRALEGLGIRPTHRIHLDPRRMQWFMDHTEAINDCLIAVERYSRETEGVELSALAHEQDLQRRAVKVTLPDGNKTNVTMDGFAVLRIPAERVEVPIGLEVDRGTEDRLDKWLPKINALMAMMAGPYQEAFGYSSLTIAVYVRSIKKPTVYRVNDLLKWTEDELTKQRRRSWGSFFLFSGIDPRECTPEQWVTTPHWVSPFDRTPRPLLEVAR